MININPIPLKGNWTAGHALDLHSKSSECLGDDEFGHTHFSTIRSEIGELIFRLKYISDRSVFPIIVDVAANFIKKQWESDKIDMVVPVPPSDTSRRFQPVIELASGIAKKLGVCTSSSLLKICTTPQIKNLDEFESRMEILKDAFSIADLSMRHKSILLFDDIFCSGEILTAITKVIKEQGEASKVYVLTLTKTRTKK